MIWVSADWYTREIQRLFALSNRNLSLVLFFKKTDRNDHLELAGNILKVTDGLIIFDLGCQIEKIGRAGAGGLRVIRFTRFQTSGPYFFFSSALR
jgi:hypothetical protein